MGEQDTQTIVKAGTQQNWEVCDRAALNVIVLYAESAAAAVERASRLLALPAEELRAKPLASHLPTSDNHHSPTQPSWDSPDLF